VLAQLGPRAQGHRDRLQLLGGTSMVFEFKLPDVGEGIHEGEVVKWHVKPGDVVKEDQLIVEVMTDKATVEITSPRAGRIGQLLTKEGQVAKVGDVIVTIEEGATGAARPSAASP